jgi:hypothetical protein
VTEDEEQEVKNLLKKSVNRLHAVKDDLEHVERIVSGGDPWNIDGAYLRSIQHDVRMAVAHLNEFVAQRRRVVW